MRGGDKMIGIEFLRENSFVGYENGRFIKGGERWKMIQSISHEMILSGK